MALTILTQPDLMSFTKGGRLFYDFQGDGQVVTPGISAVSAILFTGPVADGTTFSVRWNGRTEQLTARTTPTEPNDFPTGDGSTAYVQSLVAFFQNHYPFREDFTIDTSTGLVNQSSVDFYAKKSGPAYGMVGIEVPNTILIANSTPGVLPVLRDRYSVYVELWKGEPYAVISGAVTTYPERVYSGYVEASETGIARFDAGSILHDVLTPDWPTAIGSQVAVNSASPYYLVYGEAYGNPAKVGQLVTSSTRYALLGGADYRNRSGSGMSLAGYIGIQRSQDTALRFGPLTRYVRTNEPQYLTFINQRTGMGQIGLKVLVLWNDGTTNSYDTLVPKKTFRHGEKLTFAVGHDQLALASQTNANKYVKEFQVQLASGNTGNLSDEYSKTYRYILDYNYQPHTRFFVYLNSLGCYDSLTTFGRGSSEWTRFSEQAERSQTAGYDPREGQFVEYDVALQRQSEVTTGYRTAQELVRWGDFYRSPSKFLYRSGRMPEAIGLISKSIKQAKDGDTTFAHRFEYTCLFRDEFYTDEPESFDPLPPVGFVPGGSVSITVNTTPVVNSVDDTIPDAVRDVTDAVVTNWQQAFAWGDHRQAGYLTAQQAAALFAGKNDVLTQAQGDLRYARPENITLDSVTTRGNLTANAIQVANLRASAMPVATDVVEIVTAVTGADGVSELRRLPVDAMPSAWLLGITNPVAATGKTGQYYLNTATRTVFGPKSVADGWGTGYRLGGPQLFLGNVAPDALLGNIDDTYIDRVALKIYGPKTASGWGTPTEMHPTASTTPNSGSGRATNTVLSGPYNPTPTVGIDGDFFVNIVSYYFYGPKLDGAWGPGVLLGGSSGTGGTAGPQGPAGPIGPAGETGPQGIQGVPGPAGAKGDIGLTGPAGATGAAGPQGIQGSTGAAGAKGDIGLTGPAGAQGIQGVAGAKGDIGLTGPAGAAGPQGIQGAIGPAGAIGQIGPKGDIGLTGPTGAAGAVGATGPQGIQGLTGPAGAAGAKGDIGLTGPAGAAGAKGDIGLTGPAGAAGGQGIPGVAGSRWYQGSVAPSAGTGVLNDDYLNTTNGDVYQKQAGGWVATGNIRGPQGPAGSGTSGTGSAIIVQAGVPASATGANTDLYIDTATSNYYQKISGSWVLQGNLKGTPGTTGTQGIQGATGAAGAKGDIGLTGPAGAQGIQGVAGAKGDIGLTGPAGAAGPQGIQGAIGPAGAIGQIGPKGDIGLTGPTGAAGAVGATGPQGIQGLTGPAGAAGAKGDIGLTGPAGAQGIQGVAGAKGDIGLTGPAGPTGASGQQGIQGATGPAGAIGQIGPKGDIGLTGPTGAAGAVGATGPQGIQGLTGPAGPAGAKGDIGLTGPAGAQGIQGVAGAKGDIGLTGPAGPTGASGQQGIQGVAGFSAVGMISSAFTQPAIGGSVTVMVSTGTTSVFSASSVLNIMSSSNGASAGTYQVSSVPNTTSLTLTLLGYAGSMTAVGGSVPTGSIITASGRQGATGLTGASGTNGATGTAGTNGETIAPRAFVAAVYAQPAVGGTVTIPVTDTRWMTVGMLVSVGPNDYYEVTAVINQTNVTLKNLNYPGSAAPGSGIANGHGVGIAGKMGLAGATGAAGQAGTNGLTIYPIATVNTAFAQPAVNASVSANISDTRWMAIGTIIHINGNNFYRVTSLPAASTATLLNLGHTGSAAPGASISVGLEVGLTGIPGTAGIPGATGASGAIGPAGPLIPGIVRGATEQTRATYLTTLNQDLASGFYSIYTATEAARLAAGCPVSNWGYVWVNHHENASTNSGQYAKQWFWEIVGARRWYRDVYNGFYSTTLWQPDYMHPTPMSQATFNARDVVTVYLNKTSGQLEYSSLGALKGMLSLATAVIPNSGGSPT